MCQKVIREHCCIRFNFHQLDGDRRHFSNHNPPQRVRHRCIRPRQHKLRRQLRTGAHGDNRTAHLRRSADRRACLRSPPRGALSDHSCPAPFNAPSRWRRFCLPRAPSSHANMSLRRASLRDVRSVFASPRAQALTMRSSSRPRSVRLCRGCGF